MLSTVIGTLILGFSLNLIVQQRRQFQIDQARGVLNQNLRGTMDFLTTDIRQGGELLGQDRFVAGFSLVDGASGSPDTLRVQRKLIQDVLTVSANITAGSNTAQVGIDATAPTNFRNYRQFASPSVVRSPAQVVAYIVDTTSSASAAAKRGEFFVYSTENTTAPYQITRLGTWTNSYNATNSFIYILEDREYSLVADSSAPGTFILQMQVNRGVDIANPNGGLAARPIANSLTNFQVQAQFPAGAVNNLNADWYYNTSDPDWRNLQFFNITLTTSPPNLQLTSAERTRFLGNFSLNSQILPRNVISVR